MNIVGDCRNVSVESWENIRAVTWEIDVLGSGRIGRGVSPALVGAF